MEVPGNAQQDDPKVLSPPVPKKKPDRLIKIITIGDSNVGKTCCILRYCDNVFQSAVVNTLGVEMRTNLITLNNKLVKISIFDTAGQEKFRSITQNYYNKVDGIIMMYDVTDRNSFNTLESWIR